MNGDIVVIEDVCIGCRVGGVEREGREEVMEMGELSVENW